MLNAQNPRHELKALAEQRARALHAEDLPELFRSSELAMVSGQPFVAHIFCRRALAVAPENAQVHSLMGAILTQLGQIEEAEAHWLSAVRLAGDLAQIKLNKALALQAIGRFDDARNELLACIEMQPQQGAAFQALIFGQKVVPEDLPIVCQMEALVSDYSLPESELLCLLYSLGKSYDNLGDFEKAITYFDRANSLKNQMPGVEPFDRLAFKSMIDRKIKLFTHEFITGWSGSHLETSLPILIVGSMRSGTTLAEQILTSHPDVGGAGEQSYWIDNDASLTNYLESTIDSLQLEACALQYLQILMMAAPGCLRVVDKNPANLRGLGTFHMAFPNARIIHMHRSPIDTALSIWMTPMNTRAGFVGSRENIVYAHKQRARLMNHWRKVLRPDRYCEVRYENLVAQPETYTRKMLDFCGLEWNDACLRPERNHRLVKTPSFWQVRQPIYKSSVERWKNYEPWLGAFEELRRYE